MINKLEDFLDIFITMLWFTAYIMSFFLVAAFIALTLGVIVFSFVTLNFWFLFLFPVAAFLVVCGFMLAFWTIDKATN